MNEPVNELERKLIRAVNDPACRPDFYQALRAADVFVFGHAEDTKDGVLRPDDKISVLKWTNRNGDPIIPFFTSLEALRRVVEKGSETYLALSALALFTMAPGLPFLLNPGSDHGREFTAGEIGSLAANGYIHSGREHTVQSKTQVKLGQPAQYPRAMTNALAAFFALRPAVKAAHLCLMHDPTSEDAPSLLIGISHDGDAHNLINEASAVVRDTAPQDVAVDLVVLEPGTSGVHDYLLESTAPFYSRAPRGWLRNLFGNRRPQEAP